MEIPKHLQKDEFRFIRLDKDGEKPVDKDWSSSASYKHDAPELKAHVWNGGKIGLLSKHGKLLIIQCTNDKLEALVKGKLPSTLLVRIGDHIHYLYAFFICDDIDETGLEQCDDQNQAVLPLWASVPDVSGKIGYRMEKNEPVAHVGMKKVRDILTECFFPEKELPVSDFDMIPNGKSGWILQREIEDEKKGKKKKRLFYFSKIKLYDYDYFDVYKNRFIRRNIVELYSADAKNPMKFRTRNADSVAATRLIKNFSSFKSWQVMQLYVPDIEAWLENELPHKFKHKSKKATSIYGGFLCDGKIVFLSGENADLMTESELDSSETNPKLTDMIREEKEIAKTELDMEKAKKWLETVNGIPQTNDNRNIFYNIFAVSCASLLRCALFDMGVNLMPYVAIVGRQKQGKSKLLLDVLVNYVHNIKHDHNAQSLGGTGIRLKNIAMGSMRPTSIDDITDLSRVTAVQSMMKSGATSKFGMNFPRGTRRMEVEESALPRNIFLTANKLNITDEAFFERFLVVNIDGTFMARNRTLTTSEFDFLNRNGIQIGKLLNETIKELQVDELRQIIDRAKEEHPGRYGDKLAVIRTGLHIIKRMYARVGLEFEADSIKPLIKTSRKDIVNAEMEELNSAFHTTLTKGIVKGTIKDADGSFKTYMYSPCSFLRGVSRDGLFDSSGEMMDIFTDYGIYFARDENAIILQGRKYLGYLNSHMRAEKIGSIKLLHEKLEELGIKSRYISKKSTITSLNDKYPRCCIVITGKELEKEESKDDEDDPNAED